MKINLIDDIFTSLARHKDFPAVCKIIREQMNDASAARSQRLMNLLFPTKESK
jgi:hypothetical protein